MSNNTCEVRVGRLMEINVADGYRSVEDVQNMIAMIGREFSKLPENVNVIIAANWQPCRIFSPEVADFCHKMLTADNARIHRSAILHGSDHAISAMQVFRLVRESAHPHRKIFDNADQMKAFLKEEMTPEEQERLDEFMATF